MITLLFGNLDLPKNPLLVTETKIEEKVKPLSVKEKIIRNYYKCDTSVEWIRADNARCLPKQRQYTTKAQSASVRAVRGSSSGNTYTYGYCTWYVKNKRPDLPNNLGNADTWSARAAAQGLPTGSTPRVGAVGQYGMHVVYVTAVQGGTFSLLEMNYTGWNQISTRTVSSTGWRFIY